MDDAIEFFQQLAEAEYQVNRAKFAESDDTKYGALARAFDEMHDGYGAGTNRPFGKAGFMTLSDGEGQLQVYAKKDQVSERDFQLYKLLDIGDFIGAEGRLFRTKTNEFSIHASRIHFLVKCLVPLPEKWHGLTDIEIRYRQRYLDLIVNPDSRHVFQTRSKVITGIRDFMIERGYLEVETPMMQPIAGGALARRLLCLARRWA